MTWLGRNNARLVRLIHARARDQDSRGARTGSQTACLLLLVGRSVVALNNDPEPGGRQRPRDFRREIVCRSRDPAGRAAILLALALEFVVQQKRRHGSLIVSG